MRMLSIIAALMISSAAQATEIAPCSMRMEITINGMVCDFCARSLEKVLGRQEGVARVNVLLDNSTLYLTLDDENVILSDDTIQQLIRDAGYEAATIKRGC